MPVKGGPNIQTAQSLVFLDSADRLSYPGTGTIWTNSVSPGTFNGTLNNGISFDPDDALGALVFTGSNPFVDVGNIGAISASFSFQVAVKPFPTSSGGVYTILSYTSGSGTGSLTFKLDYSSSSQIATLSTFVSSGSVNQVYNLTASVSTGSWSILHGVFGSGVFGFYKNGTPVTSVGTTGSFTGYSSNNRLLIGGISQFTGSYLSGSVANVAVYNSSLGRRSVAINYNSLATRFGLPNIATPVADEDVQAFFDRVAAAGGVLTLQEETAISTLVADLKLYGIWSKMKAIYPMVGASAAACRQNLRSSNFTGTFTSGWTFASTGATPNGTSAFMDTFFSPSANGMSSSNGHISVYNRSDITGANRGLIGVLGTTTEIAINFDNANVYAMFGSSPFPVFAQTDKRGFYSVSRDTSTTVKNYFNGTVKVNGTTVSYPDNPTGKILLGVQGTATDNRGNFSSNEQAFASIGDTLNSTESGNFYTAVQAFQTTLNRQV
jgi:hypothetical protein